MESEAQGEELEISVSSFSLNGSSVFKITDSSNCIQISLKVQEKLIDSDIYFDTLHIIYADLLKNEKGASEQEIENTNNRFNELDNKHKVYKYYNVEIEKIKYPEYHILFDYIKKYKIEYSIEKARKRVILDGFTVYLKIKKNNNIETFEINTPTRKLYPKLIKFIRHTLIILREKHDISSEKYQLIDF